MEANRHYASGGMGCDWPVEASHDGFFIFFCIMVEARSFWPLYLLLSVFTTRNLCYLLKPIGALLGELVGLLRLVVCQDTLVISFF